MTKKINILSITLIFLIGCSENISPVDSGLEQQIYHHGNGSEPVSYTHLTLPTMS